MGDGFDFASAFAGVDMNQVEGNAVIIGRVLASVWRGMVESGMPTEVATKIVCESSDAIIRAVVRVG